MSVSTPPDLFQLLRGFAALIPPNHLQFPSHLEADVIHNFLVDRVLMNPHFQTYPPSKQYQKSFWKWVIDDLEKKLRSDPDSEFEVDSRIYDYYLGLLNSSVRPGGAPELVGQIPPAQSYITHFWRSNNSLLPGASVDLDTFHTTTLLESRTIIETGTTGMRTWLASLILAQYLIFNPDLVYGKRILELGSGIGFLGSIVASLQLLEHQGRAPDATMPGTVWMSDINDTVLSRCRDNVQLPCNLSSAHPDVKCCFLDWSAALDPEDAIPLTSLLNDELDPDLILGADIVFDPDLIPGLVAVLQLALRPSPRLRSAIIALTVRNPDTMRKFIDAVHNNGLVSETIDAKMPERIFLEPVEGGDANNGVNILKIGSK
ncbi:hypothetical protein C8R43DRAFT_1139336 [Mycena crocata]|nr:hypothetical protein C8R43DRAFT_1139336 [Mycena crocata]